MENFYKAVTIVTVAFVVALAYIGYIIFLARTFCPDRMVWYCVLGFAPMYVGLIALISVAL